MVVELKVVTSFLFELPKRKRIPVGKLRVIDFPKGFYAYVGSAMKGIQSRIAHHLRKNKKPRWHIDYLLEEAELWEVIYCETKGRIECLLAQALAEKFLSIPGFGSSDCICQSHLYFGEDREKLKMEAIKAITKQDLPIKFFPEKSRKGKVETKLRERNQKEERAISAVC